MPAEFVRRGGERACPEVLPVLERSNEETLHATGSADIRGPVASLVPWPKQSPQSPHLGYAKTGLGCRLHRHVVLEVSFHVSQRLSE